LGLTMWAGCLRSAAHTFSLEFVLL
jgi:hypothetical protein